jgi:hypothetical protein
MMFDKREQSRKNHPVNQGGDMGKMKDIAQEAFELGFTVAKYDDGTMKFVKSFHRNNGEHWTVFVSQDGRISRHYTKIIDFKPGTPLLEAIPWIEETDDLLSEFNDDLDDEFVAQLRSRFVSHLDYLTDDAVMDLELRMIRMEEELRTIYQHLRAHNTALIAVNKAVAQLMIEKGWK